MSMFYCNDCNAYQDIDYVGYNINEETDEEYCDECWANLCEKAEGDYTGYADYIRGFYAS